MKCRDYFVGSIYTNKAGLEFEIIDYVPSKGCVKRKIRFLKSGYETVVFTNSIANKEIRDLLSPSIAGVGINDVENGTKHILYDRWADMIKRCYNSDHACYAQYGGAGVYVDERWHKFSNYIQDVSKKENYDKLVKDTVNWNIDKDLSNTKCYSNDTTVIISRSDNVDEMNIRNNNKKAVLQYDKNGKFIHRYNSLQEACDAIGVLKTNLSKACLGGRKTCKGYVWKYETESTVI